MSFGVRKQVALTIWNFRENKNVRRRAFSTDQLRIRNVPQLSERFREAGSEYVVDMVLNHKELGTSLPFLALEIVVLFLWSTLNEGNELTSLVDVIATAMMLVHKPSLINVDLSSQIINAVQGDLVILVNQIVLYSYRDAVKAATREVISVIVFAVIDGQMFNQFF